jgi:hypothetical protein
VRHSRHSKTNTKIAVTSRAVKRKQQNNTCHNVRTSFGRYCSLPVAMGLRSSSRNVSAKRHSRFVWITFLLHGLRLRSSPQSELQINNLNPIAEELSCPQCLFLRQMRLQSRWENRKREERKSAKKSNYSVNNHTPRRIDHEVESRTDRASAHPRCLYARCSPSANNIGTFLANKKARV